MFYTKTNWGWEVQIIYFITLVSSRVQINQNCPATSFSKHLRDKFIQNTIPILISDVTVLEEEKKLKYLIEQTGTV